MFDVETLNDADFEDLARDAEGGDASKDLEKAKLMMALLFGAQLALVEDPARRKTARCPRGAGKTFVAAVYLYVVALTRAQASCLFIGVTRDAAKRIIWRTLVELNSRFDVGAKINNTDLTLTLANGSVIELGGCETRADIEKYRGRPFDLVILDEAKSFPALLLNELVEEGIEPRLADRKGTLCLMGTPGYIYVGLFWDTTGHKASVVKPQRLPGTQTEQLVAAARPYAKRDNEEWSGFVELRANTKAERVFGWSSHNWTQKDNTAVPGMWEEHQATRIANGWTEQNPKWIREYLGEWAADESELCVPYDRDRNSWIPGNPAFGGSPITKQNPLGLPYHPDRVWHFGRGSDLGFDAAFAIDIFAWCDDLQDFYHCSTAHLEGAHTSKWLEAYRKTEKEIGRLPTFDVVDRGGLGKAIVADFEIKHGLVLEAADKQQKTAHIELWKGEMIDGRCKVMQDSHLERELLTVCWEDKNDKKEVADGIANDHFHAALYIITKLLHSFSKARGEPPKEGTKEAYEAQQREEIARWEKKQRASREPDMVGSDIDLDAVDNTFTGGWEP